MRACVHGLGVPPGDVVGSLRLRCTDAARLLPSSGFCPRSSRHLPPTSPRRQLQGHVLPTEDPHVSRLVLQPSITSFVSLPASRAENTLVMRSPGPCWPCPRPRR